MAGRFHNPRPQFFDSTPDVYSGGKLYFYSSGTSTPLDTYSDNALSTANANPVVLNSAGRPATAIFLQDAAYKVVLKDSNDVTIWTEDPYRSRDSALVIKTTAVNGNPNGSLAGTAGSSGVLPDFAWDYAGSILYVCTTTGTSSTAAWTAINASAATAAYFAPQGRLTPTSGTPVITSDASAATAVYYTPYVGNLVPIYNGSTMVPTTFSELTLTLHSSHATNTIYDIFVFSNSGVLTLVTGPAWSNSSAGSGARGSGAGTTQIARVGGLWTNAVQITGRNGANTHTISANLATYLGSMLVDGSAGQVTCHVSVGQSRKIGIWNAYNRVNLKLLMTDSTASWAYSTATVRQSNGAAGNTVAVLCGLAEEACDIVATQNATLATNASTGATIGIGINSTTTISGKRGKFIQGAGATPNGQTGDMGATHTLVPFLGLNNVNFLETGTGTTTSTFNGGAENMLLRAMWMG